jgi:hypothetical protein
MTGEISWLHSGKAFYCHFIIVTLFLSYVVGLMDPICKTIFFSLSRKRRPDWLIFAGQIDLSKLFSGGNFHKSDNMTTGTKSCDSISLFFIRFSTKENILIFVVVADFVQKAHSKNKKIK